MRSKVPGMTTSPEPTSVRFDEHSFFVELDDGRVIGVPFAWFPRLLHATPQQRGDFFLSRGGIHWEQIDEDISVAGLLAGQADLSRHRAEAA